jgi:hypothetical protein
MNTAHNIKRTGPAHFEGEHIGLARNDAVASWSEKEAERQQCADHESFAAWIECANSRREPCAYFGAISNKELFDLWMGGQASPEQIVAASRELRSRFLAESQSDIALRVVALEERQ